MRLHITPTEYDRNNGVGRVIDAQRRYLPQLGFELVDQPGDADIVAAHIWSPLQQVNVLHNHGLEWTGDAPGYADWHHQANQAILETAKRAWAITVPSEWVAMPFKRDMRLEPEVIGHGLDLDEWQPLPVSDRGNYLLWNKNRADIVCDPAPAVELARLGLPVVSTFGDNQLMQVTGPMPHERMKDLLLHAGVYLATTKETFGIGILEALACGIPVLGYAHGGILDLVDHKKTGYLVQPGDVQGLADGYQWLINNRVSLQHNIRGALSGRGWLDVMTRYAALYVEVYERKKAYKTVGIVITNYNYAGFVGQAIQSAYNQTLGAEIVVVDDGSTDNSREVIEADGVELIVQDNKGVAAARNAGIAALNTEYVICLDADDWIEPTYVETLYKAMEADRAIGIAYTGLKLHFPDGTAGVSPWPPEADFDGMAKPGLPPPNTVPCAAMFRRDMWERAGGYRQEFAPGEDVEFWLRGQAVGFNARRVTADPLFNYRVHDGSASRTKQYLPIDGDKPWTRRRELMPMAASTKRPNLVRSYSNPLVSVIIPVGPGHAKYLPQALESLLAQTFTGWEAVVVDDAPEGVAAQLLKPYPFVRLLETHAYYDKQPQSKGAGVARNVGIDAATAPLVFFLDADDWLIPTALEKLVKAYIATGGGKYIYSDWLKADPGKPLEIMPCPEYSQVAWLEKPQHAVSVLAETEQVRKVGGFDTDLVSWEDWDFFIRMAVAGYCGHHLAEPLLIYRTATGTRRERAFTQAESLIASIKNRWEGKTMASCCGGNRQIVQQAEAAMLPVGVQPDPQNGKVVMQYTGVNQAPATYFGKYQAAKDGVNEFIQADPHDVDKLLQTGRFQLV